MAFDDGRPSPRVSIGLPVYNGEAYLAETFESLLGQTFTDFELLVSDNASIDATPDICVEFAARDARIKYHRNPRNLGAAANYNRLVRVATGEYFKWAAHDDICAPTYLERCVKILDQDDSIVLCHSRTSVIDEQALHLDDSEDNFHLLADSPADRLRGYFLSGLWTFQPIFGVIRRKVLDATPLIRPYHGSDFVLLAHLAIAGKCFEVPERLFFRREHSKRCGRVGSAELRNWWSTESANAVVLHEWRRLFGYLGTLRQQQLTIRERSRCFGAILKWAYWHRELLAENVVAAGRSARQSFFRAEAG